MAGSGLVLALACWPTVLRAQYLARRGQTQTNQRLVSMASSIRECLLDGVGPSEVDLTGCVLGVCDPHAVGCGDRTRACAREDVLLWRASVMRCSRDRSVPMYM